MEVGGERSRSRAEKRDQSRKKASVGELDQNSVKIDDGHEHGCENFEWGRVNSR